MSGTLTTKPNRRRQTETDFTAGNIFRQLVAFSVPLVMSNLLQAAYGVVDMIIAGRILGSVAISGITNGSQVLDLLTKIIVGLTAGGGAVIGQAFGQRNGQRVKEYSGTLYVLSLMLGVAFAATVFSLSGRILGWLKAPAYAEAREYLRVCAFGIPFVFAYNGLTAAIRSVGNSRFPLYCIAATSVANIGMDLLFVGTFSMGIFGAALATLISQAVSFAICLAFVWKRDVFGIRLFSASFRWQCVGEILRVGLPLAFQMSLAAISWLTMTGLINSHGVVVSAGNGVSIKIKDTCQTVIAAVSSAATAMIAQNIGAKNDDRAREITYTAMKYTVLFTLGIVLAVEALAPQLVSLFNREPSVVDAAVRNLRIEIIAQLFYASFFIFHALGTGSGHTVYVMLSSFTNCILVRVVLAHLFNRAWGVVGIYLACMIAPSTSIPLGIWFERSNRWRSGRAAPAGEKE